MTSRQGQRQPVFTPALEGSKRIVPITAQLPADHFRALSRGGQNRPGMAFYPSRFPPINPGYYNGYPYFSPRQPRYMGPPSLMPMWGGYSIGPNYYPGPNIIPVPILMKRPSMEGPWILKPPKKGNLNNRPSSMFLFGIILKEIVAALHRIYLNPSGNIYPVLNDIIGPNCYDLSALVHGGQLTEREESVLVQELQYVVENLIYHITEIMPSTGVLGTHRKSAVFELIRSGKRFPDGYFWRVEMDRIQFSEQGRTFNLGDAECFLLLTGIFISRSLITTLLMKPIDYGLSTQPLSDMAERNLRIVASTLLYLARRIAISRAQGVMPMPEEIARYLYDDNEMQHIYSRLSRTFNYCEGLLREWGTEYIRRLRASSMQQ